jgi:hypothetical protein
MNIFLLIMIFISLLFSSINLLVSIGYLSFNVKKQEIKDKYSDYRNENGLLTNKSKAYKF